MIEIDRTSLTRSCQQSFHRCLFGTHRNKLCNPYYLAAIINWHHTLVLELCEFETSLMKWGTVRGHLRQCISPPFLPTRTPWQHVVSGAVMTSLQRSVLSSGLMSLTIALPVRRWTVDEGDTTKNAQNIRQKILFGLPTAAAYHPQSRVPTQAGPSIGAMTCTPPCQARRNALNSTGFFEANDFAAVVGVTESDEIEHCTTHALMGCR